MTTANTFGRIFAACLVLCSAQADAVEWRRVTDTSELATFVDMDSIVMRDGASKVWVRTVLKSGQAEPKLVGGKEYLSFQLLAMYDCEQRTWRQLVVEYFSDQQGGKPILKASAPSSLPSEEISPGSMAEDVFRLACGSFRRRPSSK